MTVPEQIHELKAGGYTLRMLGNVKLLNKGVKRVAVIGSRAASEHATRTCNSIVKSLVAKDIVVVSGGAKGIDTEAHVSALELEGSTIIVLAQGLGTWTPWESDFVDWGRLLVVSQFPDETSWSAGQAFQRNITIAKLSKAVIAIAAKEESGSMNMIKESIKLAKPVYVPVFAGDEMPNGNKIALTLGAAPIYNRAVSGPNLEKLFAVLENPV